MTSDIFELPPLSTKITHLRHLRPGPMLCGAPAESNHIDHVNVHGPDDSILSMYSMCPQCLALAFPLETNASTEAVKPTASAVDHPAHYQGKVECIDAIEAATTGLNGFEGFLAGNVMKYLWRHDAKGGTQDLEKADWYLERLVKARKGRDAK